MFKLQFWSSSALCCQPLCFRCKVVILPNKNNQKLGSVGMKYLLRLPKSSHRVNKLDILHLSFLGSLILKHCLVHNLVPSSPLFFLPDTTTFRGIFGSLSTTSWTLWTFRLICRPWRLGASHPGRTQTYTDSGGDRSGRRWTFFIAFKLKQSLLVYASTQRTIFLQIRVEFLPSPTSQIY